MYASFPLEKILVCGSCVRSSGSVPEAAVLFLTATAWGRARSCLASGALWGDKKHFAENDRTSHAVWGNTKRHFAENDPTSHAVWGITNCVNNHILSATMGDSLIVSAAVPDQTRCSCSFAVYNHFEAANTYLSLIFGAE